MGIRSQIRRSGRVAAVVVMLLVLSACSGTSSETTTTISTNIEFGSGEVPDTVPESFPILTGSRVSSTLVNRDTGFTEMILRIPTELPVAVQYYSQNFDGTVYTIGESASSSDTTWNMTASGEGLDVAIVFRLVQPEVVEAIVTFNPQ